VTDLSPAAATAPALVEKKGSCGVALSWALFGLLLHVTVIGFDGQLSGQVSFFSPDAGEWFAHFGGKYTMLPLATAALGHRPFVRDAVGHDGQWFWLLAHDPLLLHRSEQIRRLVDRPTYRAQRVGYPLLCSVWLLGGETCLLWGMVVVNLLAVLAGGFFACRLLMELGARHWISIGFALCPGMLFGTLLDLADGVALMWLLAMLLALLRGRWRWAIAAAVAAALTKESMLVSIVAVAWLATLPASTSGASWPRKWRLRLALAPLAVAVGWNLYVRWRLGWSQPANEEITWPLVGYVRAAKDYWIAESRWFQALAGLALIPMAAHIVILWWRRGRSDLLLTAALPVAVMIPLFTDDVIRVALNSTRAASPAILLWLLALSPRRKG